MKPLLSIIIPCYNSEQTLSKALESIICQSFKDFEIWLIDGVSSDNTISIIKSFAAKDERIKWISEPDNGIYDAMNKGWLLVEGDWVYFMGSDDSLYDENVISNVAVEFQNQEISVLYGNVILPNGKVKGGAYDFEHLVKGPICHQSMFFRNRLKNQLSLYNVKYKVRADYELMVRLFCDDRFLFKYVDEIIACFNNEGFHSFTNDIEFENEIKSIFFKNFSPYLTKNKIFEGIRPSIFFHLREGDFLKGLFWFFKMKKDIRSFRDFMYCIKIRTRLL